jgi:hypothetical protein
MASPTSGITPDNCIFMTIDRQVGVMSFLTSIDSMLLKNNIIDRPLVNFWNDGALGSAIE